MTGIGAIFTVALSACAVQPNAQLAPGQWETGERARLEAVAARVRAPGHPLARGTQGAVSGVFSAPAVKAGIEALKAGGSAADAAATVALTQVTMALGSYVSYAGVFQLLYYDASSRQVHSLNAGYGSYKGETDPLSIPPQQLMGLLIEGYEAPPFGQDEGRKTLVPGFMRGVEAMHERFGRLPWAQLFEPAIHYAEQGVRVDRMTAGFVDPRVEHMSRTPEGRRFFLDEAGRPPRAGQLFRQPELAATLRQVARGGADYLYVGPWAQAFVQQVRRDGGRVTAQDLANYRPVWETPFRAHFAGHEVYAPGASSQAGYQTVETLNLLSALKLGQRPRYDENAASFIDFARVTNWSSTASSMPQVPAWLSNRGFDMANWPRTRLAPSYAKRLAPLLAELDQPGQLAIVKSPHSDALAVVDRQGNMAAIVHSSNTIFWGDTGIVVGGIPIPDSASFQQALLSTMAPGEMLPNAQNPTLVLKDGRPIYATASMGSGLHQELAKVLLCLLGYGDNLKLAIDSPELHYPVNEMIDGQIVNRAQRVVAGQLDPTVVQAIRRSGVALVEVPAAAHEVGGRGYLTGVGIDPETGERFAASPNTGSGWSMAY